MLTDLDRTVQQVATVIFQRLQTTIPARALHDGDVDTDVKTVQKDSTPTIVDATGAQTENLNGIADWRTSTTEQVCFYFLRVSSDHYLFCF